MFWDINLLKDPWPTTCTPEVTNTGASKTAPKYQGTFSVWPLMSHTEEPSFYLLDSVQKFCEMNQRLKILIHQSIIVSHFDILALAFLLQFNLSNLQLKVLFTTITVRELWINMIVILQDD